MTDPVTVAAVELAAFGPTRYRNVTPAGADDGYHFRLVVTPRKLVDGQFADFTFDELHLLLAATGVSGTLTEERVYPLGDDGAGPPIAAVRTDFDAWLTEQLVAVTAAWLGKTVTLGVA